jgi:predicted ATPase
MSHIVRFKVTALAGRTGTYAQELDRYVNIFFGLNGTGKTSLLKILHAAMNQDATALVRVPFEKAEVTIHSIQYKRNFTTQLTKPKLSHRYESAEAAPVRDLDFELVRNLDKDFRWKYTTTLPVTARRGGWKDTYLPTWRLQPAESARSKYQFERTAAESNDWDTFFARSLEAIWTNYSNELLSELQKIQGEGLVSILRGIMRPGRSKTKTQRFDADLAFNRVTAFLARQGARGVFESKQAFIKRYERDPHLRKVVDDINSIEQRIERTSAARNNLEQLISDLFIGPKKVAFGDSKISVNVPGGGDIGIAALSSGEKQMLRLLIQSLLAQDCSLLIDEPEISLHIDWQKRLISAMQLLNPTSQLILATHAPEIMADIPDEHIFRL